MANFIDKTILMMVLFIIDGYFTNGNEEVQDDTASEEELEVPGSERFPRHDQSQQADSVPFVNDNPGNFFMIQQVFKEGNYDVGYRRGNERHVKEYREIANPKTGHFKIMARWGDKNGGYGEQYWDYNHGGPDEYEGAHEDPTNNEESSLSVRSPSIDSSPSTYNSVSQSGMPDRASPPATTYSKPRIPKKTKKRYEEPPRRRTPAIPESSSTEGRYFVLPRQINPTIDEQTFLQHATNSDNGPLRLHLYERPNMQPTTYEHVLQITPSTPRSRGRTIRP